MKHNTIPNTNTLARIASPISVISFGKHVHTRELSAVALDPYKYFAGIVPLVCFTSILCHEILYHRRYLWQILHVQGWGAANLRAFINLTTLITPFLEVRYYDYYILGTLHSISRIWCKLHTHYVLSADCSSSGRISTYVLLLGLACGFYFLYDV